MVSESNVDGKAGSNNTMELPLTSIKNTAWHLTPTPKYYIK